MKPLKILLTLLTLLALTSCSKPAKDLSSYESARAWISSEYTAEVMEPSSRDIHRVEYYPGSPRQWLIVYFNSNKSKGYLYQKFPSSLWADWKAADSKGKWYKLNLKGNRTYFFTPE
ncbi:KTSC domain-containing protein [Rubritalea profundi]|nr:KTSC domain-containing protein [Rubritalea profundi]